MQVKCLDAVVDEKKPFILVEVLPCIASSTEKKSQAKTPPPPVSTTMSWCCLRIVHGTELYTRVLDIDYSSWSLLASLLLG